MRTFFYLLINYPIAAIIFFMALPFIAVYGILFFAFGEVVDYNKLFLEGDSNEGKVIEMWNDDGAEAETELDRDESWKSEALIGAL